MERERWKERLDLLLEKAVGAYGTVSYVDFRDFYRHVKAEHHFRMLDFLPNYYRMTLKTTVLSSADRDFFRIIPDWFVQLMDRYTKNFARMGKFELADLSASVLYSFSAAESVPMKMNLTSYAAVLKDIPAVTRETLRLNGFWPDNDYNELRRYLSRMMKETTPSHIDTAIYVNSLARRYFPSLYADAVDAIDSFAENGLFADEGVKKTLEKYEIVV